MNKIKEPAAPEQKPQTQRRKKPSPVKRYFIRLLNSFGIFDRNQVVNWMPYILFVTGLIIVYIANSYYAERIIREIDKTKTELKEKRAEYISTMSRLMYQRNQSELAKALEPYQVKETTEPPEKIFISGITKK